MKQAAAPQSRSCICCPLGRHVLRAASCHCLADAVTKYLASYPMQIFLVHAVWGQPPLLPRQNAVVPCLAQQLYPAQTSLQVGGQPAPEGISQAAVVHCLAQQAEQLGAFKLARMAHTRLQSLRLPPAWQVGHLWTAWPCPTLLLLANGDVLPLGWPGNLHRTAAAQQPAGAWSSCCKTSPYIQAHVQPCRCGSCIAPCSDPYAAVSPHNSC